MVRHVRALFRHDAQARLLSVNEPDGGGPAPRLFIGRTRAGNLWRVRADLPQSLVAELAALARTEPAGLTGLPRHFAAYTRLLETQAPAGEVWSGPAYSFSQLPEPSPSLLAISEANAAALSDGFAELVAELPAWQPFLGFVVENRVVSVCRSVRITPAAHEAGVETLPEFRGRGYATAVVAGWAGEVRARGALPLYSTSWQNSASQAVAKKLKLVQFGTDFHMT
jgi:GNAT superfamily N-acetyltransferase